MSPPHQPEQLLTSDDWSSLWEMTGDAIAVIDEGGLLRWANAAFGDLVGQSFDASIGRPLTELIGEAGADGALEVHRLQHELSEGVRWFEQELLMNAADGSTCRVRIRARPRPASRDFLLHFQLLPSAQSRDTRVESALELLFQKAAVGLHYSAYNGAGERTHVFVNRAHAALTGVPNSEASRPGAYAAVSHPDDYARQVPLMKRLKAGECDEISLEKRFLKGDGCYRWARLTVTRVPRADGGFQMIATVVDITDLKRQTAALKLASERVEEARLELERAVQRAEEAAAEANRANHAKTAFLAMMSHEIRTPMNGVIGMANLLAETVLDDEQSEYLETIRTSGEVLLSVIGDILDFSKIDSGKMELESASFDLRDCVEGSLALFELHAREKGLALSHDLAESLPAEVEGDPNRLRQVLINLLGNAIKFTHQGHIRLTVREPEAATEGVPRRQLLFVVEDTGVGIAKDAQAKLFEPFVQAEGSITRRFGGTGLGLAISQRLVELMGGRIWIESEVGRGSKFQFTACFRTPKITAVSQSPGRANNGEDAAEELAPPRLLLVEDNEINSRVALSMLRHLGLSADIARNGRQAVDALERQTYDIVLMDISMPVLDGLEATRQIRSRSLPGRAARPWIIALTANALQGARDECLQAGMNDYLSKPVQRRQLSAALERARQALAEGEAG